MGWCANVRLSFGARPHALPRHLCLASSAAAASNHEIEVLADENWKPLNSNFTSRQKAYNARYPTPQLGPLTPPKVDPIGPQPDAPTSATSGGKQSPNAYTNGYYMVRGILYTSVSAGWYCS